MNNNHLWLRTMSVALLVVLLAAAWVSFAPTEVGGPAAYVIVNGNSMEPGYYKGDLVVVRQEARYQVGDIVAYHYPDLGKVIHRIVAQEGNEFTLKGDHNTWLDGFHPTPADIIGKAWIHLPALGKTVEQLREPLNMAILAGVLGIVATIGILGGKPSRFRRHGRPAAGGQETVMKTFGDSKEGILFVLATVAFASLVLGIFAFTRPISRTVPNDITYEQTGTFAYTGPAASGIYDASGPRTGEPLFRRLSNSMMVNFTYRLVSSEPTRAKGTYRLNAQVSDTNGWKRTLPLKPDTDFDGASFSVTGTLDLALVQSLIDRMEKQAGVSRQEYTLAIAPEVSIGARLADQGITDDFAPRLDFTFNRMQVYPIWSEASLNGSSRSDRMGNAQSPFTSSKKGLVKRDGVEPNRLSLFALTMDVSTAREVSVFGFGASLYGMVVFAFIIFLMARRDEASDIQVKYGPLLVGVRAGELQAGNRIVDIASMDDLAKLAERDGRMILHGLEQNTHHYLVPDVGVTYRYHTNGHNGHGNSTTALQPLTSDNNLDHDATVQVWSRALDLRNQEPKEHTERVAQSTVELARRMGIGEARLVHLRRGALLHDIGEMGVPDSILLKPGPLTNEERDTMQRHPNYAYELLAPITWLRPALDIPYCHHERWDGQGYPRGLKGEEIPLAARIFAVADVWDALQSARPYRPAWKQDDALKFIERQAGVLFDPAVVQAFMEMQVAEPVGGG